MKKIWLTHTLVLCFLISLIAVGVYAGISSEVGMYSWDVINGRWTKQLGSSSGMITIGNKTPSDTYTNPTTAIDSISSNMGWDGSQWVRLRKVTLAAAQGAGGDMGSSIAGLLTASALVISAGGSGFRPLAGYIAPADAQALLTNQNMLPVWGHGTVFNGTTWDRARSVVAGGNLSTGLPAYGLYGFDGTTWDRVITSGNNSDTVAVQDDGVLFVNSYNKIFNGATWDRLRSTEMGTNLTAGLLATGLYGYDAVGGNWDRVNVDTTGAVYVNPGVLLSTSDSVKAVKEKVSAVTTESSTANNCTGTTASLISSNGNRLELIVLNQAAIEAYICFAATCTATTGMKLTENMGITNEHYTGAVSCITASGTTTIAVKEL